MYIQGLDSDILTFEEEVRETLQIVENSSPEVNFTNILQAAFSPLSFCQKNYKTKLCHIYKINL